MGGIGYLGGGCLIFCGFPMLLTGAVLMIINHSAKDGEVLPATCVCTSDPEYYLDTRLETDSDGNTRTVTETRCRVDVRAVTTPLSTINMTVNTVHSACGNCPGPTKCYINSESESVYYSKWLAESAMESYVAGAVLVGLAGFSCLAACAGFLITKHREDKRARGLFSSPAPPPPTTAWGQQAGIHRGDSYSDGYNINGYMYNNSDHISYGGYDGPASTPVNTPNDPPEHRYEYEGPVLGEVV